MITFWDRLIIVIKSFFLQTTWNAERMQNIGFLLSIRRALNKVWAGDPEGLKAAQRRSLGFFNTHPYFATAVMGAVIRQERLLREGRIGPEQVNAAKSRLAAPLNAIGTLWFWDHLKVFAFTLALPLWMVRSPGSALAGLVFFLVFLNFFHLMTRWRGLKLGMEHGESLTGELKRMFPRSLLGRIERLSAFVFGASLPLICVSFHRSFLDKTIAAVTLEIALVTGMAGMLAWGLVSSRRWMSSFTAVAAVLALSLAWGSLR